MGVAGLTIPSLTLRQRFAKADKRAKLPKWIGSYIKDSDTNLSSDMAIAHSKKFLRAMAQPFVESSKSAWGMDQVRSSSRLESSAETS